MNIDSWVERYGRAWREKDDEAVGPCSPKERPRPRTPWNRRTAAATGYGPTGGGRRRIRRSWTCALGSAWSFVEKCAAARFERGPRDDLESGRWDARHGALGALPEFDGSLRMVAGRGATHLPA